MTAGLIDEIIPTSYSYPADLLEFGLNVQMPRKFMTIGTEFSFDLQKPDNMTFTRQIKSGVFIFHGNYDRAEIFGRNSQRQDQGTSAADPYIGALAYTSWDVSKYVQLAILAGNGSNKIETGRRHDVFAHSILTYRRQTIKFPYKISLDTKWKSESFKLITGKRPMLVQQSASLTGSIETLNDLWLCLGAHYGKQHQPLPTSTSERIEYKGHQIDLGLIKTISSNMKASLLINNELRTLTTSGQSNQGGFAYGLENKKSIKRFAAELAYDL
jgi:hypothetical protein